MSSTPDTEIYLWITDSQDELTALKPEALGEVEFQKSMGLLWSRECLVSGALGFISPDPNPFSSLLSIYKIQKLLKEYMVAFHSTQAPTTWSLLPETTRVSLCPRIHAEVRGQPVGASSLLPPPALAAVTLTHWAILPAVLLCFSCRGDNVDSELDMFVTILLSTDPQSSRGI